MGLQKFRLGNLRTQYWNLSTAALYEQAVKNGEAQIADKGPINFMTGTHTGRSALDKYIVEEPGSKDNIAWGSVNKPMAEETFDRLHREVTAYIQNRNVYVMDVFCSADPKHRMAVRVISETAVHALFVRTMFMRPTNEELLVHDPQFTVMVVPEMYADPASDATRTGTFIALNFAKGMALIGGTLYCGEVKKCVFTAMNYYLPLKGVMSMHAAANVGKEGTAVFFGLSGTGKTALSADPTRELIGDDEHGWSEDGVFNIEDGCYAKVIDLNPKAEPDIYRTTQMFGTVLENVVMDPHTRVLDLNDRSITENTRAAYSITTISNHKPDGRGPHAVNIICLTCDAFGVLPPISRLTPDQTQYYFLLGYTAKVAGTEEGVTKPTATFSACFGLPFMPLRPTAYAKILADKVTKHGSRVWLLNTGWTGGPPGVGKRMAIGHTRALLHAALDGKLESVPYLTHPIFNLSVPQSCPEVPAEVLNPENTWADKDAYTRSATELASMCKTAFKEFEPLVDKAVTESGPKGEYVVLKRGAAEG